MPGTIPSEAIYAGDPWSRQFTFTQGGTPLNLVTLGYSGWSAQWRPTPGTSTVMPLTVDASNAAAGVIVVSATGPQTEQMSGDGGYDLQAMVNGQPYTWLTQQFTWTQDYTR